jgi:cytochrome c oxidase assembly protein subunit 11
MSQPGANVSRDTKKNYVLMVNLLFVVLGMGMLAYAAVPLYQLFCQVTGYGGTTTQSAQAPARVLARDMVVGFNSDTDPALNWSFKPLQRNVTVPIGERTLVFFEATNHSEQDITGTSTFNVTPFKAGQYFVKMECFCFEKQTLEAGETMRFPVSFYIDPQLDGDDELDEVTNITLSYTFFPVQEPS